jgi:hypothetical protein
MQKLILTIAITFWLVSCRNNSQVKLFHASMDDFWIVHFPETQCARYKFVVLNNTMSDTCKLGIIDIPPGSNGVILRSDCFADLDSLRIPFKSFKANRGSIEIEFSYSTSYLY